MNFIEVIFFVLLLLTYAASVILVGYDSKKNRITVNNKPYSINNGSLAWTISCACSCLIIFLPYIAKRHRILKSRQNAGNADREIRCSLCDAELNVPLELIGTVVECPACNKEIRINPDSANTDQTDPSPVTIAGFALFFVYVLSAVVLIHSGTLTINRESNSGGSPEAYAVEARKSTAELQEIVAENILQRLHAIDGLGNIVIQEFRLARKSGNIYEGILTTNLDGEEETFIVDVTYDGSSYTWLFRK